MRRLENSSPELDRKLQTLSPDEHYVVIRAACSRAHDQVSSDNAVVEEAFQSLHRRELLAEDALADLKQIADAVDAQYFDLKEAGREESEWLPVFCKARFIAALAMAFQRGLVTGSDDVVFEAAFAFDDPEALFSDMVTLLDRRGIA
jgi:hypothetical protein